MTFFCVIIAAIVGTTAFLQADSKGWRLFLGGLGLCLIGWFGLVILEDVLLTEYFWQYLVNSDQRDGIESMVRNDLRGFALALVFWSGIVMTFGVVTGALLGRWFSPGKVGGAMFVVAYILFYILIYTFAAGN